MYDILCTGVCSCDMIFPNLTEHPQTGKEITSDDFILKPGGAANTPVALSVLGSKTVYASAIGADMLGEIIYAYLERTGLDCSALVKASGKRTTVSAAFSMKDDRGFVTYFADADKSAITRQIKKYASKSRHMHAFLFDVLNYPILDIAKENGNTLSVDTAWDESIKLGDIEDVLKNCDIFFTNETEGSHLTDLKDPYEILGRLGEYCNTVVVKLGGKGSLIKDNVDIYEIPALSVMLKDTTGAGDLYVAGFLYGYLKKCSVTECGKLATASGAAAVTFYGGMDETYTKEKVLEYSQSVNVLRI